MDRHSVRPPALAPRVLALISRLALGVVQAQHIVPIEVGGGVAAGADGERWHPRRAVAAGEPEAKQRYLDTRTFVGPSGDRAVDGDLHRVVGHGWC